MQRVRHANRGRLLLRTPGPVPFGICKSYIKQPIHDPFPELTTYLTWLISLNWHHQLTTFSLIWLLIEFDITDYRFPWDICNGCGMLTGDAYSSGHLVLSHFGTCMCSNVETNLFWTCLVSGLLNFEHPSVLLFRFRNILNQKSVQNKTPLFCQYKESPCISYSYARSVASKIFNYKVSLQQLDFQCLSQIFDLATALIHNLCTLHVTI